MTSKSEFKPDTKEPEPRDVVIYTKGRVEKVTRTEAAKRLKAANSASAQGGQSER